MYPLIEQTSSSISIQRLCQMAHVPRCGYYRRRQDSPGESASDSLCNEVHCICERHPAYGYRRVTHELRRRGHHVNPKRILALMRKEKLLCRPKKRFVHTTDSRHGLRVYPNLARMMIPLRPNQLWVADLTYVRLVHGFAYLAVILDACSRRAIGWAIGSHIDTTLSLRALTMALEVRQLSPGLVHHSDQGVQYASSDYITLLASKNITISMSRKGNPYDNALAESFIKTLKAEEVYLNEYDTVLDAKNSIERFIDQVYNYRRLHSSLGYRTPVEFEAFAKYITPNSSTLTTPNTVSV